MCEINSGPLGHDKSSNFFLLGQENEPIFRSLANIQAVKAELESELSIINEIVLNAREEVNSKMEENPYFFVDSRVYSAMLNATIKGKIVEKIKNNPDFGKSVRYKTRYGSAYFIIKDRYLVYIKKLNGNGKPNYVSTPRSNNIMNQLPFDGGIESIPVLFVGPQFRGLVFEGTSITSLVSKKEVNFNLTYNDLFDEVKYEFSDEIQNIENELDNVRLKKKTTQDKRESS